MRELREIDLLEVSVVCLPADLNARIEGVKSRHDEMLDEVDLPDSLRRFERWLCRAGFSKTRACRLAKSGWFEDEPHDLDDDLDPIALAGLAERLAQFRNTLKGTQ